VPPAQSTVTVSTDQQLLDRMPGDCIDFPRQPLQGGQALPAAGIPHEALSTALAVTPGGQLRAIGAEGHWYDGPLMPHQPLEQAATPGVPHIDRPTFAAGDRPGAMGAAGPQSRIVLSTPELASPLPSGVQATPYTLHSWPPKRPRGVPSPRPFTCQMVTTLSIPALASWVPSGLQSRS